VTTPALGERQANALRRDATAGPPRFIRIPYSLDLRDVKRLRLPVGERNSLVELEIAKRVVHSNSDYYLPRKVFSVEPMGRGDHALVPIASKGPNTEPEPMYDRRQDAVGGGRTGKTAAVAQIDVLCAYTSAADQGHSDIVGLCGASVDQVNSVLQNCQVDSAGHSLLKNAVQKMAVTARGIDRIKRIARSIAGLDASDHVLPDTPVGGGSVQSFTRVIDARTGSP